MPALPTATDTSAATIWISSAGRRERHEYWSAAAAISQREKDEQSRAKDSTTAGSVDSGAEADPAHPAHPASIQHQQHRHTRASGFEQSSVSVGHSGTFAGLLHAASASHGVRRSVSL
jgi:hypothetical protein